MIVMFISVFRLFVSGCVSQQSSAEIPELQMTDCGQQENYQGNATCMELWAVPSA